MNPRNSDLDKVAFDALAQVRQNLLDLSRRNPLLNYRETKKTIKIIDEQPGFTYKYLVSDLKAMTFLPLEEGEGEDEVSESAYSKEELPNPSLKPLKKHIDSYLQTPYLKQSLESRCRYISKDARTAIEETGTNLLYLSIFFLEAYIADSHT